MSQFAFLQGQWPAVFDAAAKWAPARIELTDVHRFRRLVHHDDGTTERVRGD